MTTPLSFVNSTGYKGIVSINGQSLQLSEKSASSSFPVRAISKAIFNMFSEGTSWDITTFITQSGSARTQIRTPVPGSTHNWILPITKNGNVITFEKLNLTVTNSTPGAIQLIYTGNGSEDRVTSTIAPGASLSVPNPNGLLLAITKNSYPSSLLAGYDLPITALDITSAVLSPYQSFYTLLWQANPGPSVKFSRENDPSSPFVNTLTFVSFQSSANVPIVFDNGISTLTACMPYPVTQMALQYLRPFANPQDYINSFILENGYPQQVSGAFFPDNVAFGLNVFTGFPNQNPLALPDGVFYLTSQAGCSGGQQTIAVTKANLKFTFTTCTVGSNPARAFAGRQLEFGGHYLSRH